MHAYAFRFPLETAINVTMYKRNYDKKKKMCDLNELFVSQS